MSFFFVIHPYEPTSLRRILQSKTAQRARRVKPTTRRVVGSQSERGQCPKPDRWFESNWGSHKKKGTERMSFFFVIHPYEPTSLRRILQSKTAQRARRVKPTTRRVVGSQSERGQCPKPDRWFESNWGSHKKKGTERMSFFFVIHPYEPTSLRRILQSKTAQRARRVKPTTRRVVGSQSERGQCPKPDRWFESNWGSQVCRSVSLFLQTDILILEQHSCL